MQRAAFEIIKSPEGKIEKLRGKLPLSIFKEDKHYIAYCPVLNLTTYGNSHENAKKRFDEALLIFFEELLSMGTLEEVLKENGWEEAESKADIPTWIPPQVYNEKINVSAVSH